MSRTTIDFGIHLGASNSAIAVLKGTQVEIIKNNDSMDLTPCVVYIDKNNNILVGRGARLRLDNEPDDAYAEFKLQMGTDNQYLFKKSGRVMRPEDLSAEIIKSLRADVRQRLGEDLAVAVITVPAAFELAQCRATEKAAQLAGLKNSRLIMEPTAAAMAYAFQSRVNKDFWLVYDFGGGAFDATVLQMREGTFRIVNHSADNHLGDSLIDWEIVEKLLAPAVASLYPLTDFRRNNPKWRKAFARLKREVAEAKNRLSQHASWTVTFDYLCNDDNGEPVVFEYELKRSDVDRLVEPYIQRTVQISRQVLAEKHLGSNDIAKAIFVGSPAMAPYIRSHLSDPVHGLGLRLDDSIDPLTVFAQGAAIYAGNLSLEGAEAPEEETSTRTYQIDLQHLEGKEQPPEELRPHSSKIDWQLSPIVSAEKSIEMPETAGMVFCQSCREQVEIVLIGETQYCVNCGVSMLSLQSQRNKDIMIRITSTETRCPFCTLSIYPVHISGKYYCSECGINLKF